MRFKFALSAACLSLTLGGCPDTDPALLDAIDDVVDALPDDLFSTDDEGGSGDGSSDPLTLADLLDRFGDDGDVPGGNSTPPSDPCQPFDFDFGDDDDDGLPPFPPGGNEPPPPPGDQPPPPPPGGPDADTGNDGEDDDPPPPPGDDGDGPDNDPPPPGDDDPDDGDDGDTGDDDGDAPDPPAMLVGGYSGTITCQSWQAIVDQDPNLFELPEDPAIGELDVDLSFNAGAPDGLWIPGFIDGPDAFAEVNAAGQVVMINDSYDLWNVAIKVEVLEASYDGTTARTSADVTYRFRDQFGNLLIRAKGVVTQDVVAQSDGTALYHNDIAYEAIMWNPTHTISFDVVEIYDCDGVLE